MSPFGRKLPIRRGVNIPEDMRVVHAFAEKRSLLKLYSAAERLKRTKVKYGNHVHNLLVDQALCGIDVRGYLTNNIDPKNAGKIQIVSEEEITLEELNGLKVKLFRIKPPELNLDLSKLSLFVVSAGDLFKPENCRIGNPNILPWVVFPKAVIAHLAISQGFSFDILHAHGWQTGLLPIYYDRQYARNSHALTVFTPYSHKEMGLYPNEQLNVTGLPRELFRQDVMEYYQQVSLLKAGMQARLTLFTSDDLLLKSMANLEGNPPGMNNFMRALRKKGCAFGVLPKEISSGEDYHKFNFLMKYFGNGVLEAYRLLLIKEKFGDAASLNYIDVLKPRDFEAINDFVARSMFKPSTNVISFNNNTAEPLLRESEDISGVVRLARLPEIPKETDGGKYKKLEFEGALHYLPKGKDPIFNILSDEQRKEILDPKTTPEKRAQIIVQASRELLGLYVLNETIAKIKVPIAAHHTRESIDRELGLTMFNDVDLREKIDEAERAKTLTTEEANHLRVIVYFIQNGHSRKIWQANEILAKIDRRITFNRGTVSLINTKENPNRGRLIILSGPSGVGKDTVYGAAKKMGASIKKLVLYNTRDPRPGEKDGITYNFIRSNPADVQEIKSMSEMERMEILKRAVEAAKISWETSNSRIKELINEYVSTNEDKADVFDKKAIELAKVKRFLEILNSKGFCAISLVRNDFQAVSNEIFNEVNSHPDTYLLEVDTNLADQIVHSVNYGALDAMAIMIVPPNGGELSSRLLNRNTELPDEFVRRYESATNNLRASKKNGVHDFYITNDDPYRAAREFMRLTGLSHTEPQIWKKYDGMSVANAYYGILQQLKDLQLVTGADFNQLNLSPNESAVTKIGESISKKNSQRELATANASVIIEAVKEYAEKHPEERSKCVDFLGIRPGSDDPIHYGHITAGLSPVIAYKMNGVVFAPGGRVPDKPEISAFRHRFEMINLALSSYDDFLCPTDVRNKTANIADIINPNTEKSILGVNGKEQRSMSDIVAWAWLKEMNPEVRWLYIVGSDKVNKYATDNEKELVDGTLKELNIPVVYLERDSDRVNVDTVEKEEWLKQLWDEGFFSKCPIPSFSELEAKIVRKAIAGPVTGDLSTMIDSKVMDYILMNRLPELYKFNTETKTKELRDPKYKKTDEYRQELARLKKYGLID